MLSSLAWAKGPSLRIRQHPSDSQMAKIEVRDVRIWGGARGMVQKNLSLNIPMGMAAHFAKAAAVGNVRFAGDAFGEFLISAGRGDNTMVIKRGDGYRVQRGLGAKAESHWFGRVPAGNQIGDGKFVGRSGASMRGATLIDPVTLNKDAAVVLDGKTKQWWARPARAQYDQKLLNKSFTGSSAHQISQVSNQLTDISRLAALASFKGVTTVTAAEVRKVGRPTPLWEIKQQKKVVERKQQIGTKMASYRSVAVGSKQLLKVSAPNSCSLTCVQMGIATAAGKIVPEADILKEATGYNRRTGTTMCTLPRLFRQFGVKSDFKDGVAPRQQLTKLKAWTATPHRTAVISLASKSGCHAVLVDSVTSTASGECVVNIRDNGYDGRQRAMPQSEFLKRANKRLCFVGD
jgi:hypothetical protein